MQERFFIKKSYLTYALSMNGCFNYKCLATPSQSKQHDEGCFFLKVSDSGKVKNLI